MKNRVKVESYADANARYLELEEMNPRVQTNRRRRRKPRKKNACIKLRMKPSWRQ